MRGRAHKLNQEAKSRTQPACFPQSIDHARQHCPTRGTSSRIRPERSTKLIHPADPDDRTYNHPAMIVPTVPKPDHDPIAG
ncbi:unnamed protein product [Microthlaspi erraticum]|uniref:Uncharacterized protein n=1 Tax=Microthlaspi erraticum TaxID=1685480 RepID=A0A6D2HWE8_9BRAS|nr:unnamed protein product [Microthlaspi erraticum]